MMTENQSEFEAKMDEVWDEHEPFDTLEKWAVATGAIAGIVVMADVYNPGVIPEADLLSHFKQIFATMPHGLSAVAAIQAERALSTAAELQT